jgi:NADH dehydrogenase FAD-containing subunit
MSNIMTEAKTLDKILTIPSQLIEAQKLPNLILGVGFTGLFTALHLSHQHYRTPTIPIDRGSRFIFKPLLYEFLKGHSDSLRETAQTALQERNVTVELMLETEVIEVRSNTVVLKRNNQIEELLAATMIWATGTTINPLIDTLSIPETSRDKHGQLKLTNTLQLLDFPEVFAGGDCTVMEQPLPATAQVAYQQGAAIAHHLLFP